MEHKAFVLDYGAFERELAPILLNALDTGAVRDLVGFINSNLERLKDPYEGDPLDADWESMIETRDPHQYGDFALTKYYDPQTDIGLGQVWESIEETLTKEVGEGQAQAIVLGRPFGPPQNYFNPGKMGSYFQSPSEVKKNLQKLESLQSSARVPTAVARLKSIFDTSGKGLYVTF